MKNPIPLLRRVALIEGVSFLFLLGVAMPLKYLAGMAMAVKVAGWVHGVLFLLVGWALSRTMMRVRNWPFSRSALVVAASLLPFGPFVIDGRMKKWSDEAELDRDVGNGSASEESKAV